MPSIKEISELEERISHTENFLENQYLKTKQLSRTIRKLDSTLLRSEKFNDIMLNEGDELKLITTLETLEKEIGIESTLKVDFVGGDKKAKIKNDYYKISFLNSGTYEKHIEYLKALEALPHYIIIKEIQFETRGGDKKTRNVIARFDGKIFVSN